MTIEMELIEEAAKVAAQAADSPVYSDYEQPLQ